MPVQEGPQARSGPRKPPALGAAGSEPHLWGDGHHRIVYGSVTRTAPVTSTHPLGGRDPKAVLLHVEATGRAHLRDEVQVPAILRLAALHPLELPDEVKEAAGQDEEAAVIGRPSETQKVKVLKRLSEEKATESRTARCMGQNANDVLLGNHVFHVKK